MKRLEKHVKCCQGAIEQDILYCVPDDLGAVCRVNLQQRKAWIDICLDDENILSWGLFSSVILSGDLLILIPGKSVQVVIYNMKERTLKGIAICRPPIATNEVYRSEDKFYGGFVRDDDVYIMASSYPAILKINTESGKTEYITDWVGEIRDRIPEEDTEGYFSNGFLLDGHYAFIPGSASATIIRLDCDTDKTSVFESPDNIKKIHGLISYQEEMWVVADTDCGTSLIRWIPEKGFLDEIRMDSDPPGDAYWWKPVEIDGIFYLCHSRGAVYKADLQGKKVTACKEIMKELAGFSQADDRYGIRLIGAYQKKILFLNGCTGRWYEFDTVDRKIDSYVIGSIDADIGNEDDPIYCDTKDRPDGSQLYTNEWNFPLTNFLETVSKKDQFD